MHDETRLYSVTLANLSYLIGCKMSFAFQLIQYRGK